MITLVTALYNINREEEGDGRTFDEYKSWFKDTLKLKSPMVVFVDEHLKGFVLEHRGDLPTKIITQPLDKIPYYHLNDSIQNILDNEDYKNKIGAPQRLECNMSAYNVVIYSKFKWVEEAIKENFFDSEYFLWVDAGLSRFFYRVNLEDEFPSRKVSDILINSRDKLLVQTTMNFYPDLVHAEKTTEEYFWDARTWIMAGCWGGGKEVLIKYISEIDEILTQKMIPNNVINNEQNAMAYHFKNNPSMYAVFENWTHNEPYEIANRLI